MKKLYLSILFSSMALAQNPTPITPTTPTTPTTLTTPTTQKFLDGLSLKDKAEFFAIYARSAYEKPTKPQLEKYDFLASTKEYQTADQSIKFLFLEKDNEILISFRGSDNAMNWTSNFDFFAIPIENEGFSLHKGFYESFQAIKSQLWQQLKPHQNKAIHITGHSLGGALAQITAYFLNKEGFQIKSVHTFGAPVSGNKDWQKIYQQKLLNQSYTWELFTDPVPFLGGLDENLEPHTLPVGQIKVLNCQCKSEACEITDERVMLKVDFKELQLQLQTFLYIKGAELLLTQLETQELSGEENLLLKQALVKAFADLTGVDICTNIFSYHWMMSSFDLESINKIKTFIEQKDVNDIFALLRKMDPLHGIENYIRVIHYLK